MTTAIIQVFTFGLRRRAVAHTENQILRNLSEHVGSLLGSCFSNPGVPRRLERHDFTRRGRSVENSTSNLIVRLILAPFPIGKPLFYSEEVSAKPDFSSVHFDPKNGEIDASFVALAK